VANHAETPITLTDAPDDLERAGIMDGLRDYNEAQAGGSDACPLAILVRDPEAEIAERAARFIKAELKRADITYEELAERSKSMVYRRRAIPSRPNSNEGRLRQRSFSP
jgi:hypothetical protein